MSYVKRLLVLVLTLGIVLCLCACGGTSEDQTSSDTTTAATTQGNETTEATAASDDQTEPSEEVAEPSYSVTVVDEAGNPVVGVMLQMCLDTCVPGKTNENGVAEFFLEEADYKVSLLNMPEGYDYATEEQEWYFSEGENTMTITLKNVG